MLRRLFFVTLAAVMATIYVSAQDGNDERIAQLEKEMYRYFSSSESDSFMLVTDQLIEACRQAGASHERLFYKTWSNQAIYFFSKINRCNPSRQQIRALHLNVCHRHLVVEPAPL